MKIIKDINTASCAEIKQMILDGTIETDSLSTDILQTLMNYETDMLLIGEGDVELIERIADVISCREELPLSHDDFMAVVRSKAAAVVDDAFEEPAKKRLNLKKAIIIAVAAALLVATSLSVASTLGFSLSAFIKDFMKRTTYGSTADLDGFTVEHGGVAVEYATIEEALSSIKHGVLYPTAFPEGITVKKISVSYNDDTVISFTIVTNDENCTYIVEFCSSTNYLDVGEFSVYKTGDLEFNVYSFAEQGWYQAYAYYNGDTYTVMAKTYDELILILNNIKE